MKSANISLELKSLIKDVSKGKFYPQMIHDTPSLFNQLPSQGYSMDFPRNGCWQTNGTLRCIPGLYVAGFPKCGTTNLFIKLTLHPKITRTSKKEVYWWSASDNSYQNRYNADLYSYTDKVTPADMDTTRDSYIIDGTPSLVNVVLGQYPKRFPPSEFPPYTNADILHWVLPSAKVIATVRNPVDRAWSAYFYFNDNPPVTAATFEVDTRKMIGDMKKCLSKYSLRSCCSHWREGDWYRRIAISRSIYICYIVEWKLKFGDNLYLLNLDEFRERPLEIMQDVYSWLNLTDDFSGLKEGVQTVNGATNYKEEERMLDGSRIRLEEFFRPYNIMLAEFFNDEGFLNWNEKSLHSPNR